MPDYRKATETVKDILKSQFRDVRNSASSFGEDIISGVRTFGTDVLKGLGSEHEKMILKEIKNRDTYKAELGGLATLKKGLTLTDQQKDRVKDLNKKLKEIVGNNKKAGSLQTLQRERLGAKLVAGTVIAGATIGTGLLAKGLYDKMRRPTDPTISLDTRDREDGANLHR